MDRRELSIRRILFIFGCCFLVLAGFLVQLLFIQLFNHQKYARLAAVQRQNPLLSNSLRGNFYDRRGRIIRGTGYDRYLLFSQMNSARLAEISKLLAPVITGNLTGYYRKCLNAPFWIYPLPLNARQIKAISGMKIPELKIISQPVRKDQSPGIAWHLLGSTNENQGLSGLEYLYHSLLDGRNAGATIFTVNDGHRQYFPGLGLRASSIPNSAGVVLTIDAGIQRAVERVLDRRRLVGAIVILDVKTGEVLAMSSRPMADPAHSGDGIAETAHPYLNRAISAYHPGSLFKLVTLSAALDRGFLQADDLFYDPGFYRIGAKKWYCTTSKGTGHGVIGLTDSLAYSCNPIFIQIAFRLGAESILEYADKFGLGQPCNIGLKDESWGELPSGIGLAAGDLANMALGEQDVYCTPLQMASLIQTIANNGVRRGPSLVKGSIDREGRRAWLKQSSPVRVLKTSTAKTLQQMMSAVIQYGTGTGAQISRGGAAGKTGTAQTGREGSLTQHAWFAGFTPLVTPKFAVAVFCENGTSGGETAAPLFKEIMEEISTQRD